MSDVIAANKQAFRDYLVLETVEAGMELRGSEVKSVRLGKIALKDSFAKIEKGQIVLYNTHISPYEQASYLNVDPTRPRRLLLHKSQIRKFESALSQKGLAIVPLKVYFGQRGYVKIELALCKGKKLFDKREDIKRREMDRKIRRTLRSRR